MINVSGPITPGPITLTLVRKCTTLEKAEAAMRIFDVAFGPTSNSTVIFLGPGRYPWGVAISQVSIDAHFGAIADRDEETS